MKKKLFLVLTIAIMGTTLWAQSLSIGGHRAALDSINGMWLCSVPQSLFGQDYEAAVTFDEDLASVMIDTVVVNNGDVFTFDSIAGGKNYVMTINVNDSVSITRNITFTWLPVVELNGTFGNTLTIGTVAVSEPDSVNAEPVLAKVKWRGGATNTWNKKKRNYRIKFINEDTTKCNRRFFGLRNDNSWILDAGQMDFLRVRNRVSTDLWLDMARKPWYADSVNNVRNGSRGQMVEVLLNGEYVGIYNMCEPIDRKQLKLERYDTINNEFRGEMWTAFKWTRTVTMSDPTRPNPKSKLWDGFEVVYPDYDDVYPVDWTTLQNSVLFAGLADADKQLRVDSMGYYFDLPVMQDYYIFITTLQALDNESKNIYYACHDKQESNCLTMIPWDLDICLGQNYAPGVNDTAAVSPTRPLNWISHLPMNDMMGIESYYYEVQNRYNELRRTVLSTDSLVARYRAAIDELENTGAAAREEDRWSRNSDLAGMELDLSAEMDYVEDWLRVHMPYLDGIMNKPFPKYPEGDVNHDGEVNIADVNAIIDIILGADVTAEVAGNADVNGDGEVNIGDINKVIDLILSGN